jgi:hypothetical protein
MSCGSGELSNSETVSDIVSYDWVIGLHNELLVTVTNFYVESCPVVRFYVKSGDLAICCVAKVII